MHLDLDGDVVGALEDLVGAVVAAAGQQRPAAAAADRAVDRRDLFGERQAPVRRQGLPRLALPRGPLVGRGAPRRHAPVRGIDDERGAVLEPAAAHPELVVAAGRPPAGRLIGGRRLLRRFLQRGQRPPERRFTEHGIAPDRTVLDRVRRHRRHLLVGEGGPVAQLFRPLQRRRRVAGPGTAQIGPSVRRARRRPAVRSLSRHGHGRRRQGRHHHHERHDRVLAHLFLPARTRFNRLSHHDRSPAGRTQASGAASLP